MYPEKKLRTCENLTKIAIFKESLRNALKAKGPLHYFFRVFFENKSAKPPFLSMGNTPKIENK